MIMAVFGVIFSGLLFVSCGKSISYEKDVESHLEAAANAQTVEIATSELDIAIRNIEARGLTTGQTGILYNNQQNDIGFWYRNVKAARTTISELPTGADALTKSNTLMRMREGLQRHNGDGDSVIQPDNISLYPNQWMAAFGGLSALLAAIFLCVWLIQEM